MRSKRLHAVDEQELREVDALLAPGGTDERALLVMRLKALGLAESRELPEAGPHISRSQVAELNRIFERFRTKRIVAGNLSERYCSIHKPGSSKYHADLRYKAAFHHHLSVLAGRAKSNYALDLPLPYSADVPEIRKTAYDQVHSRLHAIAPAGSLLEGLREKVWRMKREGLSQSEIGRRLGVSRQAVSKAYKSLEALYQSHQVGNRIDAMTGEAWVSESLLLSISDAKNAGLSVPLIAKKIGLGKATVDGLVRLIDDV